jgi:hypothetical protein
MLIVICERRKNGRDGYLVALTDSERVYRRRFTGSATVALIRVRRLLRRGHRPAFPSALRDLTCACAVELAAVADLAPTGD